MGLTVGTIDDLPILFEQMFFHVMPIAGRGPFGPGGVAASGLLIQWLPGGDILEIRILGDEFPCLDLRQPPKLPRPIAVRPWFFPIHDRL
jgi:hypothetical protein